MATASGNDFIADEIHYSPLHRNLPVALYSAAVRADGELHGMPIGALAVFFDWGEQSRCIVQDEPMLSEEEWKRSRVLLLDGSFRIIAASDGIGIFQTYPLKTQGDDKGAYVDTWGHTVAFARTIGYQEYDGLGWYAVIEQKPPKVESD
jgi:hypothetical protein